MSPIPTGLGAETVCFDDKNGEGGGILNIPQYKAKIATSRTYDIAEKHTSV